MKSLSKMSLFTLLLAAAGAASAEAGQEGKGGNTVHCAGSATVVLDYYQARLGTANAPTPDLIQVEQLSAGELLGTMLARLALDAPVFLPRFQAALDLIGPVGDWMETSLNDTQDSGEPYPLPQGCVKRQAAVRQGETMFVDPKEIAMLSPGQADLLRAHEALYFLAEKSGLSNSSKVRDVIRELLRRQVSGEKLRKAIRGLKYTSNAPESLDGRVFGEAYALDTCDVSIRAEYDVEHGTILLRDAGNCRSVMNGAAFGNCKRVENDSACEFSPAVAARMVCEGTLPSASSTHHNWPAFLHIALDGSAFAVQAIATTDSLGTFYPLMKDKQSIFQ